MKITQWPTLLDLKKNITKKNNTGTFRSQATDDSGTFAKITASNV